MIFMVVTCCYAPTEHLLLKKYQTCPKQSKTYMQIEDDRDMTGIFNDIHAILDYSVGKHPGRLVLALYIPRTKDGILKQVV